MSIVVNFMLFVKWLLTAGLIINIYVSAWGNEIVNAELL